MFQHNEYADHENVYFHHDRSSGLKAIIAIHNSKLGPALGGTRIWNYASDDDAITDVLRLSKGMTYKAAISNVPFGGAKAVIIGSGVTEEQLLAYGDFVDTLQGRFLTGEDVGMKESYIDTIRSRTKWAFGSKEDVGDPSPVTAFGVFRGIESAMKHKYNSDLKGTRILVQGVGNVGYNLCKYLHNAGADLLVSDINTTQLNKCVEEFEASVIDPSEIFDVSYDIYAPCALGATVNNQSIEKMNCSIIAGSANNQLANEDDGILLMEKDILYAPDYVINAGGLIDIGMGVIGYEDRIQEKVSGIYDTLNTIFARAKSSSTATNIVANQMAEERFM